MMQSIKSLLLYITHFLLSQVTHYSNNSKIFPNKQLTDTRQYYFDACMLISTSCLEKTVFYFEQQVTSSHAATLKYKPMSHTYT